MGQKALRSAPAPRGVNRAQRIEALLSGAMSPQPEPATAERPCVGIYSYGFLAESMTFVYHQIVGVLDRFRPIVFTTRTENRDFFPYEPVVPSGFHPIRRVANNAIYNATGRVASLSSKQTALWRDVGRDAGVRLVHAHFGPGGIQAMAIADALDVPLLVTFHGYDASKALRFAAYLRSLIALFERADVIVVSNAMAEKLREHGTHKARVHVVHCGFSPDRFEVPERKSIRDKVADDETIEFLQVSSFAEKKGHRFTCEAFAAHHRRHPRSRLTLLGNGKARAKLEAHTHRHGIADAVEFAGWVAPDAVAQYMQHADVFLHHSVTPQNGDQEGIPNAIIEAMATGLPVISTLHAGIPELVEDGEQGFLIAERDVGAYVDRLEAALAWNLDVGERARARVVEHFNMARGPRTRRHLCKADRKRAAVGSVP